MKTKISLLIILLSTCLGFSQKNIAGNYGYKTECLGVELDGSETVKAWGNGRNRSDAVEQAKKNALRDVIFFGLVEGKQDCKQKPLILEVNALEKYEDYFNKFFADGGEFKNYISLRDERIFDKVSRDRKKARESVTNGLILRVLRSELKQKLIADGIIKQQ
ncbi:MAG: hypothetical protein CUR32_13065 [Flavobacterium sp.]|jgi:hypothetical protein|nr:MAG: hypothetical protein CUR32_13065 [Flavobacterium sp.] [Flavobacterium sp. FEMGT703F]